MNKIHMLFFKTSVFLFFIFLLIGCEPISVSVNSKGQIAFTRTEGVFYFDLKSGKLEVLDWNYGQATIPVIVRWAPDNETIAFTIKENKDSQGTSVFIIDNKKAKKKIYSGSSVITQMEWSTDGNYISVAQAGTDTDMGVADLVLISTKDGMSKIFSQNTGDVHRWIDEKTMLFIKINEKNQNNTDILKGELSTYNVTNQEIKKLTDVIVSKTGGMDYSSIKKEIAFTCIKAGEKAVFDEKMTSDSFIYLYNLKNNKLEILSQETRANFVRYSPDGEKILIKSKKLDQYNMDLGYYNAKKKYELLIANTVDTVSSNSSSVQAYPGWYDNSTVLFWKLNNSYGSNGQALMLFSIDIAKLKKQNHQVSIDTEVYKLVEKNGGY